MKYHLSFDSPLKHLINIEMEIDNINDAYIDLKLPIWRPGRYEAANYSKNVQLFNAFDQENNILKYEKISSSCWRIETEGHSKINIKYNYFAFQLDAGNSYYNEDQVYINFVNCLLYNEDRLSESCELTLDLPKNYIIACGLQKTGSQLVAKNYHELADSPMIASDTLEHYTYEAGNVHFHIWIQGYHQLDQKKLIDDFKKFSLYQIEMMSEFPASDYHFLFQFPAYKHYHGVEHGNSTVICIGPGSDLKNADLYSELLGVSSHELFHSWNILKIRPKELLPYDFGKPAIFQTGFVAEGFTTYYGDLFLIQSGVYDKRWYFNELGKLFQRHFLNFGRLNNSVIDSSIDLWVDGYQPSAPHKKSSIYAEGAMIALTLDLMIRQNTKNKRSFDDVLNKLWNDFGKKSIGYSKLDIQKVCEEIYGDTLQEYFTDFVDGTKPKEELVDQLLNSVGCYLKISHNENFIERELGIKVALDNSECIVIFITPDSIGESHFSIKDKIKSINGKTVSEGNIEGLKSGTLKCEIERNYKSKTLLVETKNKSYLPKHNIIQKENPSQQQKDSFQNWLKVSF